MITAQQARELCENKPFANLKEIFDQIQRRAESGLDFTWFEEKRITVDDLDKLVELGYTVKEDSTHSFKISW